MFESLFGAEMPLAVRFFVAFLIVLGVIGAIWWIVRRFGSGRLGASTRGRQPRLGVIDHARVDNRRLLILVRRDNVEHLLMIGGPSDIVVEPNIVRAVPAARDVGRAPAGIEAITRAIPLPDNGSGSWPLQPEANGGSRPAARPDDLPGRPQPESGPRQRDTLAALADELSTRITPQQRGRGNVEPPRQDQRQEQRQDPRPEPRLELRRPAQPAASSSPPPSVAASAGEAAAGGDQNLADMAQRLEAALRKPSSEAHAPANQARPATAPDQAARSDSPPPPPPRNPRGSEQRPAPPDANKPNQTKTAIYDTLEQEMANLLGRPPKS
ncbi:MAG TPA: flagellar biosynthetic protein FliO [Xanthobacteraceae bacterium]|jgi:flagellar protein FliO/FliZ|nr:flagellar biosynthetic protein FliO [Xanthobacteraceae bacterium]